MGPENFKRKGIVPLLDGLRNFCSQLKWKKLLGTYLHTYVSIFSALCADV